MQKKCSLPGGASSLQLPVNRFLMHFAHAQLYLHFSQEMTRPPLEKEDVFCPCWWSVPSIVHGSVVRICTHCFCDT